MLDRSQTSQHSTRKASSKANMSLGDEQAGLQTIVTLCYCRSCLVYIQLSDTQAVYLRLFANVKLFEPHVLGVMHTMRFTHNC